MEPHMYAEILQNAEHMMTTIKQLDWQLSTTKQVLKKYKDLCVAQQLHINAQAVKLAALKQSNDKLTSALQEKEQLLSQYQNRIVLNKDIEQHIKKGD